MADNILGNKGHTYRLAILFEVTTIIKVIKDFYLVTDEDNVLKLSKILQIQHIYRLKNNLYTCVLI